MGGAHFWEGADPGPAVRTNRLTGGATAWYAEQAADAEKQKDWSAAVWFWEQLVTREPGDPEFTTRLEKANAALAAVPKP